MNAPRDKPDPALQPRAAAEAYLTRPPTRDCAAQPADNLLDPPGAHALRRGELLLRHASDCIIMADAETRAIDVSDACLKLYGYTREEMLGMRAIDLRALEVRDGVPSLVQRLAEKRSVSYETRHRRKDGSIFPAQIGATMIDVDGQRYFQLIIRDISEHTRYRETMEKNQAAASRRLIACEAQESTRRRLSGELHARTSPNLAAIRINLDMVIAGLPEGCRGELGERLDDMRALIEDTDASIRGICSDLRSPVLAYDGLAVALESHASRCASRSGIAVRVECANRATRLAPALEALVFRLFQEALTNCLKHAQARSIAVALDLAAHPIVLTVDDDGIGFDPARMTTGVGADGIGLLDMREMAERAGGQLLIQSRPGSGTRIEARIPT